MEEWKNEKKERNDGVLDSPLFQNSSIPTFQYSNSII